MTLATIDAQAARLGYENKTCADCSYYAPRNDGTNKGWCNLFNAFAKEHHAQTQQEGNGEQGTGNSEERTVPCSLLSKIRGSESPTEFIWHI